MEKKVELKFECTAPTLMKFHESRAQVRSILGPFSCLSGDSRIWTEHGLERMDDLYKRGEPFRVWSRRGDGTESLEWATAPFMKGVQNLTRVNLEGGGSFRCARDHRVLTDSSVWLPITSLKKGDRLLTSSDIFRRGCLQGEHRSLNTVEGSQVHCSKCHCRCDEQPQFSATVVQEPSPSQRGVQVDSKYDGTCQLFQEQEHNGIPSGISEFPSIEGEPARTLGVSLFQLLYGIVQRFFGCALYKVFHTSQTSYQSALPVDTGLATERLDLSDKDDSERLHRFSGLPCDNSLGILSITVPLECPEVYYDLTVPSTGNYIGEWGIIHHNSGKSYDICIELFALSLEMPPCLDGVRYTTIGFVRENATLIKESMMRTWIKLFPEDPNKKEPLKSWVTWSPPMGIKMRFPHPSGDGTTVSIQIDCKHQSAPEDAEDVKGWELTHLWIDEANKVPENCVMDSIGRLGRVPDKDKLPIDPKTGVPIVPRFCAMLSSNMPHEKHWLWQNRLKPPQGWEFFVQPPAYFYEGMGKDGKRLYVPNRGQKIGQGIGPAENIDHLNEGFGYYKRILQGAVGSKGHARVMVIVCAQPGHVIDGEPVYGGYNPEIHYTGKKIPFDITKTLFLGFDWGFWPTCVFVQINDSGQLCVIDLIDGDGEKTAIEQLWNSKLQAKLINEYKFGAGAQIMAICDPATGGSQVNLDTCKDFIERKGIKILSCITNLPKPRIESVESFLRSTVYGGKPAFQVGADAYKIHEGMNGYYCLRTVETGNGTIYSETPCKNEWSHSQDALQYICHAIKNPSLYGIEWRNKGDIKTGSDFVIPSGPKPCAAGVV